MIKSNKIKLIPIFITFECILTTVIYGISKIPLSLYFILLLSSIIVTYVAIYSAIKTNNVFNTMTVFCLLFFMYYIFRSYYLIFNFQSIYKYIHPPLPYYEFIDLKLALFLFLLEFCAFCLGYYVILKRQGKNKKININYDLKSKIFLLISIIALLLQFKSGGTNFNNHAISTSQLILRYFTTYNLSIGFYFLIKWYKDKINKYRIYAILLVLFNLIIGIISGWKGQIFQLPLIIFIISSDFRRIKFSKVVIYGIVLITIAICIVYPVVTEYRNNIFYEDKENFSISNTITSITKIENMKASYNKYLPMLLERFPGIDSLLILTKKYDNLELLKGKTLLGAFVFFIPSKIWEDKPKMDIGNQFAINFMNQPITNPNSSAIMDFGELFYNFGWFSPIFAIILGGICGKIEKMRKSGTSEKLIAYIILANGFLSIEGNLANKFVQAFISVIIFILFTSRLKKSNLEHNI